jgi:predicted phosphoribosyltransferase
MITGRYADRDEAGQRLASVLVDLIELEHQEAGQAPVVLALPRGGVPVAAPIAERLGLDLDIVAVRKLGVPRQPELAMGAVARIGDRVELLRNAAVIDDAGIAEESFQTVLRDELEELERRHRELRRDRPAADLAGRTVIIVDDGLATGTTMLVAIEAVRRAGATTIIAAVPVGSPRAAEQIRLRVEELVCPELPTTFRAVGQAYVSFDPVPTAEVRRILDAAAG